ncbi:hypothetical protein KEM60_00213 [Austwickia sp. TVS 96-490-7B]|uniref:ribonuclease domain-containing protein n=1 Tax=Austwickia sp. TVS 96-490-7B TaxID=2830843 RepID=UPI001E16DE9E|nr:ribonuclease domain-containing protein [Austwickia sp. TVS 96-490-7B]MBW3084030.1 hypothetical protein [Austwickia sp. TVS 96-490-7B]
MGDRQFSMSRGPWAAARKIWAPLLVVLAIAVVLIAQPWKDSSAPLVQPGSTASSRAAAGSARSSTGAAGKPSASDAPGRTGSSAAPGEPKSCELASLPEEARRTAELIRAGGPFPHPRNDGVTFGNHEGRLPAHPRGYYREYTVPTPGAKHRAQRRIVTGGDPATAPPQWYYTGDHYDSFCRITGV